MRKLSFLVLIIPLLFISSIQNVFAAHTPSVELLQLTAGFYREDWPAIYKDKILWVAEGIIYVYDVKEKTTAPFFEGTQPLVNFFALIAYDGRYIIYNQYDGISYNVSAYDTKKGEDIPITNGVGSHWATDYDNKTVVYIDGGACGELYAYDIAREEANLVTENACGSAKISGNIIVWNYAAAGGTNIYGFDLSKNQQFDIATEGGFQESPDIYGNNVIYLNSDDVTNSVRLKNLRTGGLKTLEETSDYSMSWPSISKRYAVWGKNTSQHVSGVEGVDLKTGVVFEIQEQGQHQNDNLSPLVVGNIAAWMAWRTGNGDIYAAIID